MQWILLALAALALIVASTRYPRFAFGTLAVLVVLAVILYRLTTGERDRGRTLIEPSQLALTDVDIRRGYADSYVFNARIRNDAGNASLVEIELRLSMLDCPAGRDSNGDCSVIGQRVERVPLDVPPRQVRDFSEIFNFGTIEPLGRLDWRYEITTVLGRSGAGRD
jgi:hypothetical protein